MLEKLAFYGIEAEDLRQLGRLWKENKKPTFEQFFGNKTRLKEEISLFDHETFSYYVKLFREEYGLPVGEITLEEWKQGRKSSGEKLGKFLAKIVKEEKREDFLREWDSFRKCVFVRGWIFISYSLRDLLFISDPAEWQSCHSFKHEHFIGNFSYAVDSCTFIVYFSSSTENDRDFCLPKKLWRVLGYFCPEDKILILSRQYPYENKTLFEYVKQKLLTVFFGSERVKVSRPTVHIEIDESLEQNEKFIPYFDWHCFTFYASHALNDITFYYSSPIVKTRIFREIGKNIGFCNICGADIDLDHDYFETLPNGEIVCAECWDEYFRRCDYCGEIVDLERDFYYTLETGEIVCEACFSEKFSPCAICENPVYIRGDDYFEDDLGNILCLECGRERETEKCPKCGRETYILERVHEERYCSECAEKMRKIHEKFYILLPFYEDTLENALFTRAVIG